MSPFIPGKGIIFNVGDTKDYREGSRNDVYLLENALKNLGVDVTINCDLYFDVADYEKVPSGVRVPESIEKHIETEIKKHNYDNFAFVVVAFFSHGLDDDQLKIGRFSSSLQKILLGKLFEIKSLENKFKWLIVQACRGAYDYHAGKIDGPKEAQQYFLKSLACQEGCKAYRGKYAVFIKNLCKNLNEYGQSKDILYIMNKTRENMEQRNGLTQQNQDIGNLGLRRKFYFTKGIVEENVE